MNMNILEFSFWNGFQITRLNITARYGPDWLTKVSIGRPVPRIPSLVARLWAKIWNHKKLKNHQRKWLRMDKEIKKQLKGKRQWSTDQSYALDQNGRIIWYGFIVPGIHWNLSRVNTTLKTLQTGIYDQVPSGQWRPLFNKFKVGLTFQAVLLNLWQGITAR